jgi:hypothetical protein
MQCNIWSRRERRRSARLVFLTELLRLLDSFNILSAVLEIRRLPGGDLSTSNHPTVLASQVAWITRREPHYSTLLKAGRISPQTLIHHQEYHHNGDDTPHHCEYHHILEETGQMEMNPFNQLNLIFSTVYIRTNEQF